MKRILCLIFALAIMLCSATAVLAKDERYYDDEYGFSISLPDDCIALNRSNLSKNTEFIERLGYSVKAFRSKLEDANIILYAANRDNSYQIQVRMWESDFSKEIKNLSGMKGEQLNDTLSMLAEGIAAEDATLIDSRVVKIEKQPYLAYTVRVEDAFCYVENLTVIDGKCVALLYYNSDKELGNDDLAKQQRLISSLKVDSSSSGGWSNGYNLFLRVICAVLVLVAAVVIVNLMSGFIKDIRHRREQPEVIPDRIKMRRK